MSIVKCCACNEAVETYPCKECDVQVCESPKCRTNEGGDVFCADEEGCIGRVGPKRGEETPWPPPRR